MNAERDECTCNFCVTGEHDGLGQDDGPEHIDRADCWCQPVRDYKDPVTDTEVWVHRDVVS